MLLTFHWKTFHRIREPAYSNRTNAKKSGKRALDILFAEIWELSKSDILKKPRLYPTNNTNISAVDNKFTDLWKNFTKSYPKQQKNWKSEN